MIDRSRPIAIIACGDREWSDTEMIFTALHSMSSYGMNVLIEGCARGADHAAESFGRDKASHDENFVLREFPAEWDKYGKAAGPIRNHQMLDALLSYKDTHLLTIIAFHDNISASRGTKNMITIAEAAGITATVVRHPQDV